MPGSDAPAAAAPALLRALLTEHLDPGYAAAAGKPGKRAAADRIWLVVGALLVATVFAAAAGQARSTEARADTAQQVLADSVRAAQQRTAALAGRRDTLAGQTAAIERAALANDRAGLALLGRLDSVGLSAAATAVTGPGLEVIVTEPAIAPDLTDVAVQRVPGTRQVILDRDLQLAVNALWAAGAEAVAVGGVRIGPDATIRQAGGAILVDNQPIASPYTVAAIGAPPELADGFNRSSALQRLRLLETAYRVGVRVSTVEGLALPAGAGREVRFAEQIPGRQGGR